MPVDHFMSRPLNPEYSRVARAYRFNASSSPPTVPLIPCGEMRMRPVSPSDDASACCHSRTASGSAIGVKR